METKTESPRLLRLPQVVKLTGLSKSTIWRQERKRKFPSRRKISDHLVAWVEQEIDDWIKHCQKLTRSDSDVEAAQEGSK